MGFDKDRFAPRTGKGLSAPPTLESSPQVFRSENDGQDEAQAAKPAAGGAAPAAAPPVAAPPPVAKPADAGAPATPPAVRVTRTAAAKKADQEKGTYTRSDGSAMEKFTVNPSPKTVRNFKIASTLLDKKHYEMFEEMFADYVKKHNLKLPD